MTHKICFLNIVTPFKFKSYEEYQEPCVCRLLNQFTQHTIHKKISFVWLKLKSKFNNFNYLDIYVLCEIYIL